MNRYWLALIIGIILGTLGILLGPARSHDHNRPELNDWFKGLHSSSGYACCDGSDATSLDDVDWDSKDGHYRVRINKQWVDVPDGSVINEPNRAGPAMVWPMYGPNGTLGVRCFIPGSMT